VLPQHAQHYCLQLKCSNRHYDANTEQLVNRQGEHTHYKKGMLQLAYLCSSRYRLYTYSWSVIIRLVSHPAVCISFKVILLLLLHRCCCYIHCAATAAAAVNALVVVLLCSVAVQSVCDLSHVLAVLLFCPHCSLHEDQHQL
jgi:hypothetical protein